MAKPKRKIFSSEGFKVLTPKSSDELRLEIQELKTELDNQEEENSQLLKEKQKLTEKLTELEEENQSISEEKVSLIEVIRKLEAQVEALQEATKISSKDITDEGIKARMAELERENEELRKSEKDLREFINYLKRRMGPLRRTAFENMMANRRFRR